MTFRLPNLCHARRIGFWALLPAAAVLAGVVPARADDDLVGVFVSLCVENGPETARVEKMAAVLALKEATGMPGVAVQPSEPDRQTKTWRVSGAAGVPYLLTVASGRMGNRLAQSCILADPGASGEPTRQALTTRLKLAYPARTEPGDVENVVYWRVTNENRAIQVALTTPAKAATPGAVLSATVITYRPKP